MIRKRCPIGAACRSSTRADIVCAGRAIVGRQPFLEQHDVKPWAGLAATLGALPENSGFARRDSGRALTGGSRYETFRTAVRGILTWIRTADGPVTDLTKEEGSA
jgi:hypothetical protein